MAYTNHRFCWHGVISTDTATTTPFYGTVLGWDVQTVPMGGEDMTLFAATDGKGRAHTRSPMGEEPSHWSSYFRVEDVDASAQAAAKNGGSILVPPTDIAPGRFSTVASPSGATFNLFHEADPESANPEGVEGGIHWVELHSTDLKADLAWLKACFGISSQIMEMPAGPYHVLMSGETTVGGAMAQMHAGAPSMWLPWVQIDAVDEAVDRAAAAGGNVVAPLWEVDGVGRLAIVADPTGGVFGVIRPAPPQA